MLHKYMLYGFVENLDTVRHIRLGKFWGVRVSVTPLIWLNPLIFLGLYLLFHWSDANAGSLTFWIAALISVVAIDVTTLLHAFGHIFGGKFVKSPMDELLLTATRGVNIYPGEQSRLPSSIHLGRALGGPIFNLLLGVPLLLQLPSIPQGGWYDLILVLASTNLFFGLGALLPLPSVDGQVIWRELFRALGIALRRDSIRSVSRNLDTDIHR